MHLRGQRRHRRWRNHGDEAAGIKPSTRPTTGQDATVAGVQRIITGDQYMTVYKAVTKEARVAAEIAVPVAKGNKPRRA